MFRLPLSLSYSLSRSLPFCLSLASLPLPLLPSLYLPHSSSFPPTYPPTHPLCLLTGPLHSPSLLRVTPTAPDPRTPPPAPHQVMVIIGDVGMPLTGWAILTTALRHRKTRDG
jgi:hypothetical protein